VNLDAPLTPAMRDVLRRMARAGHPPLHTLAPAEARAAYEAGANVLEVPRADLARVQDLTIPAHDGHSIPARLYAPSRDKLPVLLYFHGGGFTIGSVATHDVLCREISRLAGCIVVSVDYRLAPEHKFPVAVLDMQSALLYIAQAAIQIGASITSSGHTHMAVGGDSAGGTLAAVAAILARDTGLPLALQLLIYPGCSAHQDTPSHSRFGQGLVLETEHIDFFFDQYLTPDQRTDWRFSPLNAPDVDGVAPAWMGLAECDPLVDEGLQYADKLRASGVTVDLEIYRGVTHEFIKMGRVLPEARQAHADMAAALARAFAVLPG
jgi:acetyl esterase